MSGTAGLLLRAAERDEDAAIRAVVADAFPDNPKTRAAVTAWQWWDNPWARTRAWVWEDAGRVVACYVGYPVPVRVGGRPATAALGVDAAVAGSHQGRGLFVPLSKALYADCAAHGMPLVVCYPNDASRRGITRAGWVGVEPLRTLVLPVDDAWLAARFSLPRAAATAVRRAGFRSGRGAVAAETDEPPDGLDDLWSRVEARSPYGVVRDAAWWRWRYAEHPDRPYRFLAVRRGGRLVGAAAVRAREAFGGRFLCLLELLAVDDDAARALVRGARQVAADEGAVGAALVATAGSDLDRRARRAGLRRLPRRLEPKPLWFGMVPAGDPDFRPAEHAWSVAWGDLDHI